MKAGLPKLEPQLLKYWNDTSIEQKMKIAGRSKEKFILHDGPPYANGNLHIGHALNKILKDVINRSQQMMGKDARYVPGWDCHGLPIEWKIEEKYRKNKKNKDNVPIVEFRKECRDFATHWINVQREEFKRMGILGDWDHPYTTMTNDAEAIIAGELCKFLMDGSLYKGAKPVLWSPVEKTALAEAEVEYYDHTSTTIHVRFRINSTPKAQLQGASIVIWTTTPWTIPGNRAVAVGPEIDYALFSVTKAESNSLATVGEKLIVANPLIDSFSKDCGIQEYDIETIFKGSDLIKTRCRHPLSGHGYDFDVPILGATFANTEEGTGIIHIAPGHGEDDWELGQEHKIEAPNTVGEDGCFYETVPLFAGMHVYKCNGTVAETLSNANTLIGQGKLVHRYPHSWRSKRPLIFRNTAQWFISMEKTDLRDTALRAIDVTRFFPEAGKSRLKGMIKERPDWCVSRQRAWGVPITVFVNKETGEPLRDQEVVNRIVQIFRQEGSDSWFSSPPNRFLGSKYRAEDFDQVTDILDVWFDSGSTHAFVLEGDEWPDLTSPASLYLEGTDQHRGWFHSSLLESAGTRGHAPFKAILTHGFVMAEDGQKMSKSLNNQVFPQKVIDQFGADILRLWVIGSDYSEDLRIGPEILSQHSDVYRRLRNTLRFIIGNLNNYNKADVVNKSQVPELERWIRHRLWELDSVVRTSCQNFEFHTLYTEIHNFCANDLSAFYLDIRKDSLYCDEIENQKRRACQMILNDLFDFLTSWLAPFLCFTAEEAWLARYRETTENGSVHLGAFPEVPDEWCDPELGRKWKKIRTVRRVVTGALELERTEKRIGSSLQASPIIFTSKENIDLFTGLEPSEIFITSGSSFSCDPPPINSFSIDGVNEVNVEIMMSSGTKCERCYQFKDDIGHDKDHPTVCVRCAKAVNNLRIDEV